MVIKFEGDEKLKNILILIVLLSFIFSGCANLSNLELGNNVDDNAAGESTTTREEDKETKDGNGDFIITFADGFEGEQKDNIYGAGDYARISNFIKQSTLDNFFAGMLQGEVTKTADNPYLMGEVTEDGTPKNEYEDLRQQIVATNPVEWLIADINPVNDSNMLLAVKYCLPDGKEVTSGRFMVKNQAGEWYIDFESFRESFTRVAQFAAAGSSSSDNGEE